MDLVLVPIITNRGVVSTNLSGLRKKLSDLGVDKKYNAETAENDAEIVGLRWNGHFER